MAKSIAILMGSANDKTYFEGAETLLKEFGIDYELKVLSAHRTPDETRDYVRSSDEQGCSVFIAGAGGAAHLAGAIAAHTTKPVIGVPLPSSDLNGFDALLSTVQMPSGVPVATVSIGKWGGKNAAILAVQMLSLKDVSLQEKLKSYRQAMREKILA